MKIIGTAKLKIDSDTGDVIATIDIESGEIIINPRNNTLLVDHFSKIFEKKISLSQFKGVLKGGDVCLETFPKLFVRNYHLGVNLLDGYSLKSFEFVDKYIGFKLILKPYHSRITLNFHPIIDDEPFTEFHFLKVNMFHLFDFKYDGTDASAVLEKGHAIIKVAKKLSDKKIAEFCDIFEVTSCLAFGAYSSIREIFTSDSLILNLSGYAFRNPPHRLISKNDFESLLNSVIKAFNKSNSDEMSLLKNAIYYLEGGYKQTVHIEFRLISLFTSLEILDKSKTLDKRIIKEEFNLKSQYDSALMISVRNKLIHDGMSVISAIKKARDQNQERDVKKSELESLFINYPKQEYLAFYYFMLDLLTKYLHEKFNYSGSYKPNLQTLETNNSIL